MSDIYYWEYALQPRAALNASSGTEPRRGALIRVGEGHGCIHPWPELGDDPLEVQLRLLAKGVETPLITGARECALYDGEMRKRGVGLQQPIPGSHWLVRPGDDPGFAREEGFRIAKIKGTRDSATTRSEMRRWIEAGFAVRLDYNECLKPGGFLEFWRQLSDEEIEAIDFVEDPEEYSEDGWSQLRAAGIKIGVDRDGGSRWQPGDVLVVKPARPDSDLSGESRFLMTSYMDHAIGQMWAAHKAATIYEGELSFQKLACGLLTHRCYDDDDFFERLCTDGPRLLPVRGTGLGFDDLLEKLPWKRLA